MQIQAQRMRLAALAAVGLASVVMAATRPATSSAPATTTPAAAATVGGATVAFLEGKVDAVEASLGTIKEAGLSAGDKADLAYLRLAMADARPVWWKQIKSGRTMNFRPSVWNRPMIATFDPGAKVGVEASWNGGRIGYTLTWPYAEMDASEHAEHGFSKGELCELGVWMNLGNADAWAMIPASTLGNYNTDASKLLLNRFLDFRGMITGTHYGMPRSRRWGLWLCMASYMQKYAGMQTVQSRRAVAAVFMQEVLSHPEKYPSLKIPADIDPTEEGVALFLKDKIEKKTWSLAEDRIIRDALKVHAGVNEASVLKNGRVALANGTAVSLDPEQDKPLREKRDAWIKVQIGKMPKNSGGD